MLRTRHRLILCGLALLAVLAIGSFGARAADGRAVFVIALENHNWTQPVTNPGGIQQIYQNVAAPYINSLVNGTAVGVSDQVAYASAYYAVLATPTGANPSIHPSEPNYLWAEAGTNFGIFNDNDPYSGAPTFPNNFNTTVHLSTFLTNAGHTWKSYQEDADLVPTGTGTPNHPATSAGGLNNVTLARSLWTVPLISFSGTFVAPYVNAYNGKNQYNYASKHNPELFFTDSNGGNDASNHNLLSQNYAPLQQLATDLAGNTVADYNWITPNQYNDMHTALSGGYKGLTGDAAQIKQGDDFIKAIVPMIMASQAYQNHGVIIIWTDETEPAGAGDTPSQNDYHHTLAEIVISKDAHPNVNGVPYASSLVYTHSSDLRTMQEIFGAGVAIRDAANALDLSDLFKPGVISNGSVRGNLTISEGQSVTLSQDTVSGNVKVDGGTLFLSNGARINGNLEVSSGNVSIANSTVGGNLQFNGGGSFAIGAGAVINGNLQIHNLPASADLLTVCGATVGGNVEFHNSDVPVAFGLPVAKNSALVAFTTACGNTVGGNLQIHNNSAPVQVFNNVVKGNLQCQQNSTITGGANTARQKQDECSAF